MPNAKTHDTIGVVAGIVTTPIVYVGLAQSLPPETAVTLTAFATVGHAVGTYWLSPDLDIDSAIDDRWGPLAWLWLPYRWLVPHRHWISHSGISALLRLVYLALMVFIVALMVALPLGATSNVFDVTNLLLHIAFVYKPWLSAFACGVVFADLLHCAADLIATKRSTRHGSRKRHRALRPR